MTEIDWRRHYMGAVDPIEEMQELVAWAAEHYEIGLLSNIMPGFIEEMMKQHLLPHADYKAIIDSSKAKAIKPEDRIYEVAEAAAGCDPPEILLIDDARANLMSAEKRNWHVLWFDDYRPSESVERVKRALEFES